MKKIILICCMVLFITGCSSSSNNEKIVEISDSAYTTMNIYGAKIDTTDFVDSMINDGLSDSTFDGLEEYINEEVDKRLGEMLDQCDGLSGDELGECLWEESKR